MKVTLIARTETNFDFVDLSKKTGWLPIADSSMAEELIEFAGRACYQSWNRPNPKTASNKDYIAHILEVKHLSVVEHATCSFYIENVSRSLTHELVRHRHFSFSQLSQRYVEMKDVNTPVIPPLILTSEDSSLTDIVVKAFYDAVENYEHLVRALEDEGATRKKAREAARCVLPNCTPTSIVVSGNLRSWLEFLSKRNNPAADAEIQELSEGIRQILVKEFPAVFQEWSDE